MLRPALVKVLTSEALPISLDELKHDLRVDSDDDDDSILRMAQAAGAFLERRTGISVIPGRYEALLSEWFCEPLELYRHPVREMESIEYLEALNTWTAVDLTNFQQSRRGKSFLVNPLPTFTPPNLFTCFDSVKLTFTAGFDAEDSTFGDALFPIEADVKTLLHMAVGEIYKVREMSAQDQEAAMARAVGSWLGAHRTHW